MIKLANCLVFCCLFLFELSAQERIILDESFDDWSDVPVAHTDASGDGSGVDFGQLWLANDDDFFFFRIEVGNEINIQNQQEVIFFVDTDNNSSTGTSFNGIGAELVFNLGDRNGAYYNSNGQLVDNLQHEDIELITSPTVSSDEFEIAVNRNIIVNGSPLFPNDNIKFAMANNGFSGDLIPNSGGISYTFTDDNLDQLPSYAISKPESTMRIMSYNGLFDNIFEDDNRSQLTRILNAVDPDLIGFQEIYDYSAFQTKNIVDDVIPAQNTDDWYAAKVNPDVICVSKYPIEASSTIAGGGSGSAGNGAFLLSLGESKMLFIVAHLPCCNNDEDRQQEVDAIMAFIRTAKSGNGPIPITQDTPIVITGDMNLVGDSQQVATFLTGDIVFSGLYGSDFAPDWDGSDFEDAKPRVTDQPFTYTWNDNFSSFFPGRLDYLIYSGSVMNLENSFSLFTKKMTIEELQDNGLQSNDTNISDHLPIVADFELLVTSTSDVSKSLFDLKAFPNPTQEELFVQFDWTGAADIQLDLTSLDGKLVQRLKGSAIEGNNSFNMNVKDLARGQYILTLSIDNELVTSSTVSVK